MVQLNSANLTDTFEKDGKCYVILEISRKTCIKWIYQSLKHDVTYSLQDMNNFLNSLFLIKKKNIKKKNRNKLTKIAPSEAEEEIDLNNSTSSTHFFFIRTSFIRTLSLTLGQILRTFYSLNCL